MEQTGHKIREPKQKRSIELKMKIVETAIEIFSEKGYFHTSSNEISAAANVSVGSFYSYFKDKKSLFIEAIRYFNEKIGDKIQKENTNASKKPEKFIKNLLQNILLAHKFYPGFHKELTAMQILDPDIGKIHEKMESDTIDTYYQNLQAWKDQLRITDLKAASYLLYKAIDSVIHEIVNKKMGKDEEEILLKELADMVLRYLW